MQQEDPHTASRTATPGMTPSGKAPLALLLAINLLNYVDRQVLAAVEPSISKDFFPARSATADLWIGLPPSAFMASYILAAPFFGWLADRTGRWTIVGASVLVWSLASGGSGLAGGIGALLVSRVFVGLGEAAYGPAAPAIIAELYPAERRGQAMGAFYLAIPVGSALGYLLGGQITAVMHDWRWAFFAVVPAGLALGVVCFAMPEARTRLPEGGGTERGPSLAGIKYLLRTPSYVLDTLGMTAMTFALGGMAFWMPRYVAVFRMQADPGSEAGRELLASVNLTFGTLTVLTGVVGTLAGAWLCDRLRPRMPGSYFTISGLGMIAGFPLFLLVMQRPFPEAWLYVGLAELCLFLNTGPTNTILANVTHPAIRASAFAITIFVIHLFNDAGSPFLMSLVKYLLGGSWDTAFFLVALAFLASRWVLAPRREALAARQRACRDPRALVSCLRNPRTSGRRLHRLAPTGDPRIGPGKRNARSSDHGCTAGCAHRAAPGEGTIGRRARHPRHRRPAGRRARRRHGAPASPSRRPARPRSRDRQPRAGRVAAPPGGSLRRAPAR